MERKDRNFWILNQGALEHVDLEKRWQESGGDSSGEVNYQYYEMFHCNEHTDTGCDYERKGCLIQPGDVVVDVGGNMGIFARRAWERGASKIVSFEPQKKVYECYSLNSKPEMECYNIGIADFEGTMELCYGESLSNTGGGSMFANYEARGIEILHREACKVDTLDNLLSTLPSLQKVDFLKIDCEGGESSVLKGISDENLSRFRCISMEVHKSVISDEERENMVKRITDLGYYHWAMFYGNVLVIYNFWKF
jgi:FkbM family methyltransferase